MQSYELVLSSRIQIKVSPTRLPARSRRFPTGKQPLNAEYASLFPSSAPPKDIKNRPRANESYTTIDSKSNPGVDA